ncbi:hypothetical protein WMY93_009904 [Mugilogobius chulae]|uniref:G patch domain-containing protein 4 n=1 Tax=Mugilogobius chulae TaxID=88201 RepID=A0AAW0P6A2_9GOBI
MAGSGADKSRGLQFAERQLLRHGWEHGKGLGRAENGISEAIKVKVKCDKGGIGHKEGDQFTFHWWDHVFNQTSASLQVESDHAGTKLHKNSSEKEGAISNKKPLKYSLAKDKLYGAFVKSATLVSGLEQPWRTLLVTAAVVQMRMNRSGSVLDTKMSDAELVKACGGRTAHKGARHGLNMSAKLARLEQQEAEFMAKYGKKTQPEKEKKCDADVNGASEENAVKMKKKKKKKSKDCETMESTSCLDQEESKQTEEVKRKKKKKKDRVRGGEEDGAAQESPPPKKKKKKSKE